MACIETERGLFALEPSLARAGLPGRRTVMSLFDDWARCEPALSRAAGSLDPADRVEPTRRLAPLLYPGKILCAGANYFDHLAEMGMPGAKKAEQRLFFFMKPPRNAVVGDGDTVHMPIGTQAFDWEIELAAVIGRPRATSRSRRRWTMSRAAPSPSTFPPATTTVRPRPSTSSTGWPARPTTPAARSGRAWCRPGASPIRRTSA